MYGFGRRDTFPIDRWVKNAIKREYFKKEVSEKEIYKFAKEYFGQHASFLNLLIFNYERKKREYSNICVWK